MKPSLIITILTLLTFSLGLLSINYNTIESYILTLLATIIISFGLPRINHLSSIQRFKILITTYIFGIADGYYIFMGDSWDAFGIFIWLSTVRYYGEMQLVNNFHHHQLQWESYLIYHSSMYFYTNLFLIAQHAITKYVFHFNYKQYHPLMKPALVLAILSTLLRILAFFTAKSNFTHKVSYSKKYNHTLVTHGIYSIFRHPSYTGFFYYTFSTMILIGNFVSAILFACMLSFFFDRRIQYEEYYLLKFFGDKYEEYKKKTYVLIPFFSQSVKKHFPEIN